MKKEDVNYLNLKKLIVPHLASRKTESAAFLNWFLEDIYRLNDVEAADAICDESNDKGIDGIYVDATAQEVHFFQTKITQKDGRTLGDSDLKTFVGALHQFQTIQSIDLVLAGNANAELKKILQQINLKQLVIDGYKIVGVFVANQDQDHNCKEYLQHHHNIRIFDREKISLEHIDYDADEGVKGVFDFDTSYAGCLSVTADQDIEIFVFPAKALELIKLAGIDDNTLFKQNVRLTLGNTDVNKSIAKSIGQAAEHKHFPLYHNGITLLCNSAKLAEGGETLRVQDYVVVNGAQSISTFYKNAKSLSEDLRVFTKVISLRDEELARKITLNSNNQNAIKARDLRSNHNIMLRLKAEFEQKHAGYHFEIKRGEASPSGKVLITNELAGRLIMSFDLEEPHSSHQIYKVFDEKYADIFGRPEVTASRIVFLYELSQLVSKHIGELGNSQMAGYALTRFFVLNVLRHIMEKFPESAAIITSKDLLNSSQNRAFLLGCTPAVLSELIIDFSYEIKEEGDALDYKSDLKSPERVRNWRNRLLSSFDKEVKKGKASRYESLATVPSMV